MCIYFTYLFISACEVGKKDIVKMLLDHKANGRIHPITRYSPLYIVAFKGKKDVVEILLKVIFKILKILNILNNLKSIKL